MLIADGKTAALSSSSLQADTINMVAKHAMKKYFFFIVIAILMINNPDFAQSTYSYSIPNLQSEAGNESVK